MTRRDIDELADDLAEFAPPEAKGGRPPQEERVIAGFEDIQRFYATHRRLPQHGAGRDIFERLYAVRLERLQAQPDALALLAGFDTDGLLSGAAPVATGDEAQSDEALLAELGIGAGEGEGDDVTRLRHVASFAERQAAEEIATRTPCGDFNDFKPLFEQVQRELKSGVRKAVLLEKRTLDAIQKGTFFIAGGQLAYIADVTEAFRTNYERRDSRLRVIYDNGTESHLLQRSFQRGLHYDEVARLVTEPSMGPLFGDRFDSSDIRSGTLYVLRSHSDHPFVREHRELIHKIGVTGGKVAARIANASKEATYLLAEVEVVAEYSVANINATKLENLFHRLFSSAQIDLEIADRFGQPVKPREWFLVPLHVIDEAVEHIKDGTITGYVYDPMAAKLVPA